MRSNSDDSVEWGSMRDFPDKGDSDRRKSRGMNYGAGGLLFLITAAFALYFGIDYSVTAVPCTFQDAFSSNPSIDRKAEMLLGIILAISSGLLTIIAVAMGGAGMATNRGSFFGFLTIMLVALPLLYLLGTMFFGLPSPAEFMTPAPNNSATVSAARTC